MCIVVSVGLGQLQNSFLRSNRVDPVTSLMQKTWTTPGSLIGSGVNVIRTYGTKIWRLNQVEAQNRALRDQLRGLGNYSEQISRLEQQIAEDRGLMGLEVAGRTKQPARIISYSELENRIRIDAGSNKGVKPLQPVVSAGGLLGQVSAVDANSSEVTLITSPTLKVAALAGSGNRVVGLVHGENARRLVLEIQDLDARLQPGDLVTTTGLTSSYPRGLPIGDVIQVTDSKEFGIRRAFLAPRARLEDISIVMVLE